MTEANVERALVEGIAEQYHGGSVASVSSNSNDVSQTQIRYDFGASMQDKIAALVCRDAAFNERTNGLIKPEYFESAAVGTLVAIALEYFERYRRVPNSGIWIELLQDKIKSKVIRGDLKSLVIASFRELMKENIGDRDYITERVADFAKDRAFDIALLKSVELKEKGDYRSIEKIIKQAIQVGSQDSVEYDFFEEIDSRTEVRKAILDGDLKPTGITTGIPQIDQLLYNRGWGRKELSILMGGPKSGKTTGLLDCALAASMAGENVIYITLEVSKEIASDRIDSNISEVPMDTLRKTPFKVEEAVKKLREDGKCGAFKLHEYPSNTLKPSGVKRLIEHYKSNGLIFDLVVIDYLDIMTPEHRNDSTTENSRTVWVDCRAIAQEEGFAMLSATQTNREGFTSAVSRMEHVADDINKIRTADLVISINKTEEEQKRGEARLYFAASRNQGQGYSVHVKQALDRMKFVVSVLSVS